MNTTTRIELELSWSAYTRTDFDLIYDAHAARIGHRPAFTALHGGDHARITTTSEDGDAVRAILADAEHTNA